MRRDMMHAGSPLRDDSWRVKTYVANEAVYDQINLQNVVYTNWVFSFIAEGQVDVLDGSKASQACAGQVMIHAPHLPFGERASIPGRHLWLLADIRNGMDVELMRLYPVAEVVTLADASKYEYLFRELAAELNSGRSEFGEIKVTGLVMQLMFEIMRSWELEGRVQRSETGKRRDIRLEQVIAYLNSSLHEKVTRDQLAELVHLNANYLDRIFEETYAMKPMQLLRELRMKRVKHELEYHSGSLQDIAERCGLGDASYLTHQFIKRYGVSPGKYREQARLARQSYYEGT
ncbi:helix-turn-helix transcriptional regulator [Paenibacillus sp. GCM10023252]|uniref:helix-turn-helix transcriptional regulator n=1 Tax=Paenibacillus sp. GCM10023252 TaxID=3252649 RepID=UPI0036216547